MLPSCWPGPVGELGQWFASPPLGRGGRAAAGEGDAAELLAGSCRHGRRLGSDSPEHQPPGRCRDITPDLWRPFRLRCWPGPVGTPCLPDSPALHLAIDFPITFSGEARGTGTFDTHQHHLVCDVAVAKSW